MIRKFAWYTRDLAKRRVVLMHDRRAVLLLDVTGSDANDRARVCVLTTGRTELVLVSSLYEPREPEDRFMAVKSPYRLTLRRRVAPLVV